MSRKSYPNVNAANQYARDVVRGKIVACQFVIQACQRHLDDLMAEKSKSFRYRFDKDLAERAAKFIQLLPHTKGEWAFKRMPITLEPWQLFVICCAFGWVNKGIWGDTVVECVLNKLCPSHTYVIFKYPE